MATVASVGALNNYTSGQLIIDTEVEADFDALKTAINALLTTLQNVSINASITASTTQTQGQQPLTDFMNVVDTVANNGDVVTLPDAATVAVCVVVHGDITNTTNDLTIYPASGDHIVLGVGTPATLSSVGNRAIFISDGTGWWPWSM